MKHVVYFIRRGSTVEDRLVVESKDRVEKEVDASLITRVVPLSEDKLTKE